MLFKDFKRKDAKTRNHKANILKFFVPMQLCLFNLLIFFAACSSQPTDLMTLAPAETLIYLEANDLGKTLQSLTENKEFEQSAKAKPDFSALKGIQTAIAVTGFEASENQVTAENSVLNFKPHFVAIADTHSWNSTTLSFTENKLGEFVNETYGGEVSLETADKNGGKSFVWVAKDGRKVFAFVKDSRIFFSNDETALEKSLSVSRGESDSFAKNGKTFEKAENTLAVGYISTDGIAQISNFAGISTAMEATEDEDGRSFIARVFPQIIRNTVKEISWTATKTEQGIEDKYAVLLNQEATTVFKETMQISQNKTNYAEFLPSESFSVTRYNLQNPQIAWRSLLLVAGKNTDVASGNIIVTFFDSLLEPYGISDAETFLSAADSEIWTANFDAEGEKSVVVVAVKNAEILKKSIAEIEFKPVGEATEIFKSKDGEISAAFVENKLILGNSESVTKCLQAKQNGQNLTKTANFAKLNENNASAITFGKDLTNKIVEALSEKKEQNVEFLTNFTTETRFNDKGLERKTVSPFGLIGRILEQLEN
jgi:hypothetical protein